VSILTDSIHRLTKITVVTVLCTFRLTRLTIIQSNLHSPIKAYVRRDGTLGHDALDMVMDDTYVYEHLFEAAYHVTADDAKGWFHHCGYI
jgi:hypothetical protein